MYFEASFDKPAPLETVEIDASPDQTNTCIRTANANPAANGGPSPNPRKYRQFRCLRTSAAGLSKPFEEQGVTHLLIHKDEHGASDFETRQTDWGIAKVGESGPARLYRIEVPRKNIRQR